MPAVGVWLSLQFSSLSPGLSQGSVRILRSLHSRRLLLMVAKCARCTVRTVSGL